VAPHCLSRGWESTPAASTMEYFLLSNKPSRSGEFVTTTAFSESGEHLKMHDKLPISDFLLGFPLHATARLDPALTLQVLQKYSWWGWETGRGAERRALSNWPSPAS